MKYTESKMRDVADKPEGFWGRRMLNHMNSRHRELIKWGLAAEDLSQYADVLDIGCGSGNSLAYMYRKNPHAHYFGIDYSKDSVKAAKRNNKEAAAKGHMKVMHGDACDLKFPNCTFDLVVSIESFYYWKDHGRAIREISRVLKKNGIAIIVLEANADVSSKEKYEDIQKKLDMMIPGEDDFRRLYEAAGLAADISENGEWIRAVGTKK